MFGLSRKKKPENALDAFIQSTHGNPPPPKTASLSWAANAARNVFVHGGSAISDARRMLENL